MWHYYNSFTHFEYFMLALPYFQVLVDWTIETTSTFFSSNLKGDYRDNSDIGLNNFSTLAQPRFLNTSEFLLLTVIYPRDARWQIAITVSSGRSNLLKARHLHHTICRIRLSLWRMKTSADARFLLIR